MLYHSNFILFNLNFFLSLSFNRQRFLEPKDQSVPSLAINTIVRKSQIISNFLVLFIEWYIY